MKVRVRILAARNARALHDFRPSHGERAQGKPGADCTRGPRATKSTGVGPQVNRSNAGFPCAVVYGLFRALPGDRAFLPPSWARCASIVANLDASIGASGPHDFAVRDIQRSSRAVIASTASHRAFVTCATPLLSGGTGGLRSLICPTTEAEYFCAKGWTDFW